MTWHWNPQQSTFDLYDHNGDLVRENVEFSGSWTGDYPDKIIEIMHEELTKATDNNNNIRVKRILNHIKSEQIKQGKPNWDNKALDEVKQIKLKAIREEAQGIIGNKWPLWKQQNCNAGIYPQATKDQKDQDMADVISASNSAEDKVNNASSIADVEKVIPNWPAI